MHSRRPEKPRWRGQPLYAARSDRRSISGLRRPPGRGAHHARKDARANAAEVGSETLDRIVATRSRTFVAVVVVSAQ